MSIRVRTPIFRVGFARVFEPQEYEGKLQYSLVMFFTPEALDYTKRIFKVSDPMADLNNAINQVIKDEWGANPPKGLKLPIRDGAEKEGKSYGPGILFANVKKAATSRDGKLLPPPEIVDASNKRITDSNLFYSGCYAMATINVVPFDGIKVKKPSWGRGVSLYIGNIQKVLDGERIDTFTSAEEEFTPVDVPDEIKFADLEVSDFPDQI